MVTILSDPTLSICIVSLGYLRRLTTEINPRLPLYCEPKIWKMSLFFITTESFNSLPSMIANKCLDYHRLSNWSLVLIIIHQDCCSRPTSLFVSFVAAFHRSPHSTASTAVVSRPSSCSDCSAPCQWRWASSRRYRQRPVGGVHGRCLHWNHDQRLN